MAVPNGTTSRTPALAIGYIVSVGLSLSLLDTSAKYLVVEMGFETPFLAWMRFLVHSVVVFLLLRAWRNRAAFRVRSIPLQAIRGLTVFGTTLFTFMALQTLQLAEMVSILFASPLIVTAIAAIFLKETVGGARWFAVALGFLGVLIITRPGFEAFQTGHLHALMAMLSFSLYVVMTRSMGASETAESLVFYSALAPVVLMAPVVPAFAAMPQTGLAWFLILSLGVYGALGHWFMIKAYQIAAASALAPYTYLHLVWMTGLGFVVFGDVPDAMTLGGAALIVGSGLYLASVDRRR
jgi:drug/metabolite transporter (DMT)-like permease